MTTDHKISISVIIPTLNAKNELPSLLSVLHSQTVQPDEILVVDSASDDDTVKISQRDPSVTLIQIKRKEYDHGGTRDMAARAAAGDVVVFLTQDALPADEVFLQNLTSPLAEDKSIAVSTGRQLPKPDASYMEALVREYNYPDTSNIRSKEDIPKYGIKTFFSSDVCSAYNRDIFLELGGFEHPLRTNEDMFYAAKAINSGYRIAYAADARVYHSHNLTLRQQFKRNYVQGYEIARHNILLKGVPLESEGKKLVKYVTAGLMKQKHIGSVFCFGADCAARLAGSKCGRAAYKRRTKGFLVGQSGSIKEGIPDDRKASLCILVSTYNGEKYLQQQLDSLYKQKEVNIIILARDDGSIDSTQSILKANAESHSNFSWYSDEHRGSAGSFLKLIQDAPEADYYALCDQDDVWDDDKLKCAVDMLQDISDKRPALYYSNLRVVDNELNFHRNAHSKPWVMKSKYSALVDVAATGCTMVFNRTLRDLLKDRMPASCKMHDEWIYLVCRFFGTVVYDFDPHISYRQHGGNVLGLQLDGVSLGWIKQKIKRTTDESWKPRSVNAQSLVNAFRDDFTVEDLKKARKVAEYKMSLINRIALLTDMSIHGKNLKDDLKYRFKVLVGKE